MSVKFGEFEVAHGCWKNYIQRFIFCLQASAVVEDSLKKANLLAVCGSELYELIISLISPCDISEVTFSTIKSKLDDHFHPTPNEIVQSYKFHMRNQEKDEKVRDYIAQLRKLSIGCNFRDLERTLRDRLVCGIFDKEIQKRLLQMNNLTFEEASKIVISYESAVMDANIIVAPTSSKIYNEPMEINKISYKTSSKEEKKILVFDVEENMATTAGSGGVNVIFVEK